MSTSTRVAVVGALVASAALAWGVVEHQRAGALERDALARELKEARAQLAEAREAVREAPTAQVITVGQAADPDAIAARIAASNEARARAEKALAAAEAQPTTQQLAGRDAAQRTLDAALARGRWTPEDLASTRAALADDPDGRYEIARQLSVAINTSKIAAQDPRTLFP
jgi:hypothetical protein